MKLSEIIQSQANDILIMCAGGMTVMILRDLLRFYQAKRKPAAAIAFLQDLLFWILAALLASSFLYKCAYGQMSVHALTAFGIGAALWETCFMKKFSQSSREFYDIINSKTKRGKKVSREQKHGKKKKEPRF